MRRFLTSGCARRCSLRCYPSFWLYVDDARPYGRAAGIRSGSTGLRIRKISMKDRE